MGITIGCVGCGNMGSAILLGLKERLNGQGHVFCGCNRSREKLLPLQERGVELLDDAQSLAQRCDVIVLAVKPYQAEAVLESMLPALASGKIVISVAAGLSLACLRTAVQGCCPVVRCMPNTPALVGQGIFAFCFEDSLLRHEDKSLVLGIFSALGLCLELEESSFAAFSALIGAGPAYVFAMMQGLVQAGVSLGFSWKESRRMVTALFAGSAQMAGLSAVPLMQLRDEVCSPGGLTIAGVNHLDRKGLTGILVDAVLAAAVRGREMES